MKTNEKQIQYYVHIAIVLFFMFIFDKIVPPFGTITPFGITILGIFLGAIYGWAMCDLFWPSILVILAIGLQNEITMATVISKSFGAETVVFILFIFIFNGIINQAGINKYLANKVMSVKFFNGRPWVFTSVFLLGSFLVAGFGRTIPAMLIFWSIIIGLCQQYGFKPSDKYPALMVFGVGLAGLLSHCLLPIRVSPITLMKVYESISGVQIDPFKYLCFMLPISLLIMICYLLMCKFIFKPDISLLANIDNSFINKEDLILNKNQAIALGSLILLIVLLCAPGFLPAKWPISQFLNSMGNAGITMSIIVILCLLKVDGTKFCDFQKCASNGVMWNIILLVASVTPLAALLTAKSTGISQALIDFFGPFMSHIPAGLFVIAVLLSATLLTNIINNAVIATTFIPITVILAQEYGFDPTYVIVILILCVSLAYITPAASAIGALIHGYRDWLSSKDMLIYGGSTLIMMLIIILTIGVQWGKLLF